MTFDTSGAAVRRGRSCAVHDLGRRLLVLLFTAGLAQLGCNADGFELPIGGGAGDDAGPGGGDGGPGGDAGGVTDAGPDATPPIDACPIAPESCNGEDDDCDGTIDEDFLPLESNPAHCGACGNACSQPHAAGTCVDSVCQFTCLPGYHDLDENVPGCEYQCIPTNGGVESCDLADNDCDGATDEGFDTSTDELNCGGCGNLCTAQNATPECSGGVCGYTQCDPGYADILDGVPGCEYQCPENPPLAEEECDGQDDDCDGTIDELPITGLGDPCSDYPQGDTGECAMGQTTCQFGTTICTGDVGPVSETCDGLDNDCDGASDETYDFANDEQNCGSCGNVCAFANAVPNCSGGQCEILSCLSGWVNANGSDADGCEYQCTPSGPEACDGVDNDCDTLTDTADPDLTAPGNFCKTAGECASATPECSGGPCGGPVQWRCVYDDPLRDEETDLCGNLVLQEAECDSLDNDCDGRTDESYALLGTACGDGDLGECAGTGTYGCNATEDGLVCNISDPGADPVAEACNDLDDDCDGTLDEGAPDSMVVIDGSAFGLGTFAIYAYEASRPDATATGGGSATHRSCSNPDVRPWRLVSQLEAAAACAASGKRLCTEAEWQLACATTAGFTYPYGDTYEPNTCNGRDYDTDPVADGNQDDVVPTGSLEMCVADWALAGGAYDMSGNLKEWTGTEVATDTYRVRGGSYDNIKEGLTCQFDFVAFDEDIELPNLGFRCCETVP